MYLRTLLIIILVLISGLLASWKMYFSSNKVSYNKDVRPIFNTYCLPCHGGIKQSGGFSLLFEKEALDTTDSGLPAILPGDAEHSELVKRLKHNDPEYRMPLDHAPLSKEQIDIIETWINQGANWEQHWAYIPPDPDIQPTILTTDWSEQPIDLFILEKMQEKGLEPSPNEDPSVLLRRLHFDLVGVPPSLSSWKSFLQQPDRDSYERIIDSLLNSPSFGEKWATLWLDLARYADSKGYEKDLYRSIWKYRDWVIQALNDNMPFDQFTLEQLAGDLLPNPTQDQLIATAFHRNTMANDEGGTDNEEYRNYAVIERVGTTFEVWQSTTMACAQCHSHPYDPFRQEEFYKFMAYFNNTEDRDIYHEGPNVFTFYEKNKKEVQNILNWVNQKTALPIDVDNEFLYNEKEKALYNLGYRKIEAEYFDKSSSFIELVSPDQDAIWQVQDNSWIMFEEVDLNHIEAVTYRYESPYSGYIEMRLDSVTGKLLNTFHIKPQGNSEAEQKWDNWKTRKVPFNPQSETHDVYFVFRKDQHLTQDLFHLDWIFFHESNPRYRKYGQEVYQKLVQLDTIPAIPTPVMNELTGDKRRKTHIFERGSWLTKGDEVEPGLPNTLTSSKKEVPSRLEMARWLVNPENPLTARVFVNRVWAEIFGRGLVSTVEDFGTQGEAPSHELLLDWLAVSFVKSGWDIKYLIKQMVLSATYRQSAVLTPQKQLIDPNNIWLSRGPRLRMSAEQLRDQALAASGLLSSKMYGPGVRPPIPNGVSVNPFVGKWEVSEGVDRYRRAIYTYVHRTSPYPNQITFDASDRTTCLSRRITTNTPLQALSLLNDPVFMDVAKQIGKEWNHNTDLNTEEILSKGYEQLMLRPVQKNKLQLLTAFFYRTQQQYIEDPNLICEMFPSDTLPDPSLAAWTVTANAMLNLDEMITK